ncbi:MAG: Isoprenyl transferase [Alphaproteobacteria bacterium MarineAlpha5_Bin8]|nr:MAG: Isoprenyl transferase [Alphaproteobacteria bacterium MarineAlpha5_Bin8]PPR53016.1 MAG: Isoprenyl transferase [Alphaproteobacteria bacterium MarineAlpha5_Bin6]
MIMDGNKRWSDSNGVSLKNGYIQGFNKIEEIIKICITKKIKYLTLYALSSENIKRSSVSLIYEVLLSEYKKIFDNSKFLKAVKVNVIGEKNNISNKIIKIISDIENKTKSNDKLFLNIAFNYGTDKEIISIIKNILKKNIDNVNINNALIRNEMYLSNMPDPDILIRTGGYKRLSNFLLMNLSYTELFFTETLWPDLKEKEILSIFEQFNKIKRNYGL